MENLEEGLGPQPNMPSLPRTIWDGVYAIWAERQLNSHVTSMMAFCRSYIMGPVSCSTGSILLACKISHTFIERFAPIDGVQTSYTEFPSEVILSDTTALKWAERKSLPSIVSNECHQRRNAVMGTKPEADGEARSVVPLALSWMC